MARTTPSEPVTLESSDLSSMSKVEKLKANSDGLFWVASREKHSFASELDAMSAGEAQTIGGDAKEISKHFGVYKQQERVDGRKTGDHMFMVRIKLPAGGELSPEQWDALCRASAKFADGTLRLTTRQGIQFHRVMGRQLGGLIRCLNERYKDRGYPMTTLGACGDVNRNTMCSPVDDLDAELPLDSRALAHEIARELAPRAAGEAYRQIFLIDEESERLQPMGVEEPFYGKQYLPRKFKVAIAHPHDNSVELQTQDVGLLPVVNGGAVAEEFDLYSGGGLGITHNQPATQQLLGCYLGRIRRSQVVETVKSIGLLQKEHGERKDRRQARWKYTLRRLGVDTVKRRLREQFGIELKDASPQAIPPICYHHGWQAEAGAESRWFLGIPVESGRLRDTDDARQLSAVKRIVSELDLGVRITANQDLLLCHVPADRRSWVDEILREHGVPGHESISRVRRQAFACPAKPTCGLAMTDAENALPGYARAIEEAGLGDIDVIIRIAGCPNSCSRPPTAEIGVIGYGKNDHLIQVGGARDGTRIGSTLYDRVPEENMKEVLIGILRAIRDHNPERLAAGKFLERTPASELRGWVGYPK